MNDRWKPWASGALVLVAITALVVSSRSGCASADRYALAGAKTDEAVVARIAEAVGNDQEPGTVVFIRYTGFIPSTEKLQKVQVEAFRHALPGGYEVVELPPESLAAEAHGNWALRTSGGNWGEDLMGWMAAHSNAVAVVSLVGIPNLPPTKWKTLPPFYGVESESTPYHKELLKRGFVDGLVVMREDVDAVEVRTFRGPDDELFDLAYTYLSGEPDTP